MSVKNGVKQPTKRLMVRPLHLAACLAFAASHGVWAQQASVTQATPDASEKALPTVKVTATQDTAQHLKEDVSSGALGARSQLDTPFSTAVVTSEELQDRQPSKLGDVFATDASVTDNGNAYNAWATYVTVRGMQLDWQSGFKIDGLPFNSYGITMPYEQLEKVELLKGLTGFMYGFGAPGGVVNYVTKKPPVSTAPVRSIDIGYQTAGVWSEHADLGGRVGPNGVFGYRLNATHEEGKTYNEGNVRRDSVSLALDARITRDLKASFGALYQERHASGITGAISTAQYPGTSLPRTLSGGTGDLSGPDQHLNTNVQLYTAGVQYNLSGCEPGSLRINVVGVAVMVLIASCAAGGNVYTQLVMQKKMDQPLHVIAGILHFLTNSFRPGPTELKFDIPQVSGQMRPDLALQHWKLVRFIYFDRPVSHAPTRIKCL